MDPNACLSALLREFDRWERARDDASGEIDPDADQSYRESVLDHIDNLREWIARGGFPPGVQANINRSFFVGPFRG